MKSLILILALSASVMAFTFAPTTLPTPSLQALPWPFTTCGDADWTIETLTLAQTPKRNINDDIVVVIFY